MQRLSTLAVNVAIQSLHIPNFYVPAFQREAVADFDTLLPTVSDSALLPLLQQFLELHLQSLLPPVPSPASFAAIGQSLIRPSSPPSSPSSALSTADKDITRLLAFQAKHPILNASDSDAIRAFLQAYTNYKTTGLLSMYDCIGADARTALELVYCGDRVDSGSPHPWFLRSHLPTCGRYCFRFVPSVRERFCPTSLARAILPHAHPVVSFLDTFPCLFCSHRPISYSPFLPAFFSFLSFIYFR